MTPFATMLDSKHARRRGNGVGAPRLLHIALSCVAGLTVACGSPEEAPTVELAVYADASGVDAVTTDLGYRVELDRARMVISNLQFAIAGEVHTASLWRKLSDFVLPNANAHPGHYQGGEVTGELRGRYVVDWLPADERELGVARLIAGTYHSANFGFESASKKLDDLTSEDELVGHTAVLGGTATRGETRVEFSALIDSPKGRQLVGVPFEREVSEGSKFDLGLALVTKDALEGDTLFDGIDFATLESNEGDGVVLEAGNADAAVTEAYNQLRRTFQTHDHFAIKTRKRR